MKHSGKAMDAALKLVGWTFILLMIILAVGLAAAFLGSLIKALAAFLVMIWILFVAFTFYFFRDPEPRVPADATAIVSPAHGTVDVIDETEEKEFLGGRCKRISIFLSVFNVHVQQSPVAGKIAYLQHTPGLYLNALKTESAAHNENVLIGIESAEKKGEKIGVRLITGLIARRIVPWIAVGNEIARSERISLIQFGSRVDIYLPLSVEITAKLGDKVVGGETIVAKRK